MKSTTANRAITLEERLEAEADLRAQLREIDEQQADYENRIQEREDQLRKSPRIWKLIQAFRRIRDSVAI